MFLVRCKRTLMIALGVVLHTARCFGAESIERSSTCGEVLMTMIPALGGVHRHKVLTFLMNNHILPSQF
jgi:hypothetical protein